MAELADAADSKSAGTWYLGGSTPPPGTNNFGIKRLWSLPSTPLLSRNRFQGRKEFAHEQTRVRLEVCPYRQEVALLQTGCCKESAIMRGRNHRISNLALSPEKTAQWWYSRGHGNVPLGHFLHTHTCYHSACSV